MQLILAKLGQILRPRDDDEMMGVWFIVASAAITSGWLLFLIWALPTWQ
jgi:hypothetical protein